MAAKKKTTPKSARGKRPTKKAVNQAKGKRYTAAEKSKVLAMVEKVNAEKGRGGITAASRKFGVTPLTISAWMRNAGLATRGGGKVDAGPEVFQRLAELHKMILQTEEELSALNQPPFPRPPIRPNGSLRGLPQKQIPSSKTSMKRRGSD